MPATHPLTPFYINSREGRERVTIVDVYEYAGRPLARVDSVDYGVRFSLPESLVHLDDELAKAQAIAAAHPLNPEGAYERLLLRHVGTTPMVDRTGKIVQVLVTEYAEVS